MELREEVAEMIEKWCAVDGVPDGEVIGTDGAADAILSLPRIKEALQVYEDHEKMIKTINEHTL